MLVTSGPAAPRYGRCWGNVAAAMRSPWIPAVALLAVAAPSAAEPFVEAYLGKSFSQPTDIHVAQPGRQNDLVLRGVAISDQSFAMPIYYGVRAGYFFDGLDWLGVSAEMVHVKMAVDVGQTRRMTGTWHGAPVDEDIPLDARIEQLQLTHGTDYFALNLMARYGFWRSDCVRRGRLQPYAGLGVAAVVVHPENQIDGVANSPRFELGGPGFQAFAGARVQLVAWAGLFVEYKFTASNPVFSVGDGGQGWLQERTHHLVAGASLRLP